MTDLNLRLLLTTIAFGGILVGSIIISDFNSLKTDYSPEEHKASYSILTGNSDGKIMLHTQSSTKELADLEYSIEKIAFKNESIYLLINREKNNLFRIDDDNVHKIRSSGKISSFHIVERGLITEEHHEEHHREVEHISKISLYSGENKSDTIEFDSKQHIYTKNDSKLIFDGSDISKLSINNRSLEVEKMLMMNTSILDAIYLSDHNNIYYSSQKEELSHSNKRVLNGYIVRFNLETGEKARNYIGNNAEPSALHRSGDRLYFVDKNSGKLYIKNLETGEMERYEIAEHFHRVDIEEKDNELILVDLSHDTIYTINIEEGEVNSNEIPDTQTAFILG